MAHFGVPAVVVYGPLPPEEKHELPSAEEQKVVADFNHFLCSNNSAGAVNFINDLDNALINARDIHGQTMLHSLAVLYEKHHYSFDDYIKPIAEALKAKGINHEIKSFPPISATALALLEGDKRVTLAAVLGVDVPMDAPYYPGL